MPNGNTSLLFNKLSKDPNYSGIGSSVESFQQYFSDPKNAKILYDKLSTDKNYSGIGSNVESFVNYFDLKKKSTTPTNTSSQPSGKSDSLQIGTTPPNGSPIPQNGSTTPQQNNEGLLSQAISPQGGEQIGGGILGSIGSNLPKHTDKEYSDAFASLHHDAAPLTENFVKNPTTGKVEVKNQEQSDSEVLATAMNKAPTSYDYYKQTGKIAPQITMATKGQSINKEITDEAVKIQDDYVAKNITPKLEEKKKELQTKIEGGLDVNAANKELQDYYSQLVSDSKEPLNKLITDMQNEKLVSHGVNTEDWKQFDDFQRSNTTTADDTMLKVLKDSPAFKDSDIDINTIKNADQHTLDMWATTASQSYPTVQTSLDMGLGGVFANAKTEKDKLAGWDVTPQDKINQALNAVKITKMPVPDIPDNIGDLSKTAQDMYSQYAGNTGEYTSKKGYDNAMQGLFLMQTQYQNLQNEAYKNHDDKLVEEYGNKLKTIESSKQNMLDLFPEYKEEKVKQDNLDKNFDENVIGFDTPFGNLGSVKLPFVGKYVNMVGNLPINLWNTGVDLATGTVKSALDVYGTIGKQPELIDIANNLDKYVSPLKYATPSQTTDFDKGGLFALPAKAGGMFESIYAMYLTGNPFESAAGVLGAGQKLKQFSNVMGGVMATSIGDLFQQAHDAGADNDVAMSYAMRGATVNGLMWAMLPAGFKAFSPTAIKGAQMFNPAMAEKFVNYIAKGSSTSKAFSKILSGSKNLLEGTTVTALNHFASLENNHLLNQTLGREILPDKFQTDEFMSEMFTTALTFSPVSIMHGLKAHDQLSLSSRYYAGENPETFLKMLGEKKDSNQLTQKEYDQAVATVKLSLDAYKSIPDDITNINTRIELHNTLFYKKYLEAKQANENTDESLKTGLNGAITVLKKQIPNVANGTVKSADVINQVNEVLNPLGQINKLTAENNAILGKDNVTGIDLQKVGDNEAKIEELNKDVNDKVNKVNPELQGKIDALKKEKDGLYKNTDNVSLQQDAEREKQINSELSDLLKQRQQIRTNILENKTDNNLNPTSDATKIKSTSQVDGSQQTENVQAMGSGNAVNQNTSKQSENKKEEKINVSLPNGNEQITEKELPDHLSPEEKQGSIRGGQVNAAATIITSKVHDAIGGTAKRSSDLRKVKDEEENYLKDYAENSDVWLDPEQFNNPDDNGNEQDIYYSEDGKIVTKVNTGTLHETWKEYFDRLNVHNTLFPDTAYKVKGFTEHDGKFAVVLEQRFITKGERVTFNEVKSEMEKMGFHSVDENSDDAITKYTFENPDTGIIITDLHGQNVIKGKDGIIHFIDPLIEFTHDRIEHPEKYSEQKSNEPPPKVEGNDTNVKAEHKEGDVVNENDNNKNNQNNEANNIQAGGELYEPPSTEKEIKNEEDRIAKEEKDTGIRTGVENINDIAVRPDVFQFKEQDEASGVNKNEKLEGNFDKNLAGTIGVWKDVNGELGKKGQVYVVDGHHRMEFAKRNGEKQMNVFYIDAPTAKDARVIGAKANIAQGRGTSIDAAKVYREATPEQLDGFTPKSKTGKEGQQLAKLSDTIFNLVVQDKMDIQTALSISKVPKEKQESFYNAIQRIEKSGAIKMTPKGLSVMADKINNGAVATNKVKEVDLFGTSEKDELLFAEQSQLEADIKDDLSKDARILGNANKNKEVLEKAQNVVNTEENQKLADQSKIASSLYDTYKKRKSVADIIKQATEDLSNAKNKKEKEEIKQQAFKDVKAAIQKELDIDFKKENKDESQTLDQQLKTFGVADKDVKPVKSILSALFDNLKKAGIISAKTIGDWVGIGKGEEKTYSLKINGKDVQVKNVGVDVVNGFYSPIEKTINETKFDKLPAKQWLEKYANSEEAKWTGLKDWLAQQQGSVSKADIQQFLKDNRIQVVEVVKGSYSSQVEELYKQLEAKNNGRDFDDWKTEDQNEWMSKRGEPQETKFSQYQLEGDKENYREVLITMPSKLPKQSIRDWYENTMSKYRNEEGIKAPKFEDLSDREYDRVSKEWLKSETENGRGQFKSSHFDEPNIVGHIRISNRVDADGNKVLHLSELQSDWGQKGKKEGFKDAVKEKERDDASIKEHELYKKYSAEKDEALASQRDIKQRATKILEDAVKRQGEKIEWFDDDIYHAVRTNATIPESIISKKEYAELKDGQKKLDAIRTFDESEKTLLKLGDAFPNVKKLYEEYNVASKHRQSLGTHAEIPTAPFVTDTTQWVKLLLKHALKTAVADGAKKITWESGETQNSRYDLSKTVDSIAYRKNADGTYHIMAVKGDDRVLDEKNVPENKIADYVGKDVTQRIINNEGEDAKAFQGKDIIQLKELTGNQLKVGGKGMIGFYGSPKENKLGIVGEVAKKLFKQEPKTVEIKSATKNDVDNYEVNKDYVVYDKGGKEYSRYAAKSLADVDAKQIGGEVKYEVTDNIPTTTQHSIDITPELKAEVNKGLPLFQDANAQFLFNNGKAVIEAIKNFKDNPKQAIVSITHEIQHGVLSSIFDGAKSGNQKATEWANTVIDEYNKKNGTDYKLSDATTHNEDFKSGKLNKDYEGIQEFVSRAWEQYHHEGAKGFSEKFQKVLDHITDAFRSIYQSVKDIPDAHLTDNLRKVFDDILGKENLTENNPEKPTTENKVKPTEISDLQKAKDEVKAAKQALKDMRNNLGAINDPEEKAKALIKYHKALVKVAKEYVKAGVKDVAEFAKELGEKITNAISTAWKEANGDIKPIDDAKDLPYDEKIADETTGIKKALNRTLPPTNVPKLGKDVERLAEGKKLVDGGKINPRDVVQKVIDGKGNVGYTLEEQNAMKYYAHQLKMQGDNLRAEKFDAEQKVKANPNDVEAAEDLILVKGDLQQHDDEVFASMQANQINSNHWGKSGLSMQDEATDQYEPSMIKHSFSDGYDGKVPKEVQDKLDSALSEIDKANAELNKLRKEKQEWQTKNQFGEVVNKAKKEKFKSDIAGIKAERKDILNSISDKLKNQRKNLSVNPIPVELLPDIAKLVHNYAKEGVVRLADLIDNIHTDLSAHFAGLSKDHVKDSINDALLDEAKKNALTNEKTLNTKLSTGNILTNKPKIQFAKDTEIIKQEQRIANAKHSIKQMRAKMLNSQLNKTERFAAWLVRWRRRFALSGVGVLEKLSAAAAINSFAFSTPEEMIGHLWSNAFPSLADKAPIEGWANAEAEGKFWASPFHIKDRLNDIKQIAKTGSTDLGKKYGEKFWEHYQGYDIMMDLHTMIKSFPHAAEFERANVKMTVWAAKKGLDIQDPLVKEAIGLAAFKKANYAIFLNDNELSQKYNKLIQDWGEGHQIQGKLGAFVANMLIPVNRVPINIASRAGVYLSGLPRGLLNLHKAYANGIENLPQDQAEEIMRQLKKGSVGAALLTSAFLLGANNIGGLYTPANPDKKRKFGEAKSNEINLFGFEIPHFMQHSVPFMVMQTGATFGNLMKMYYNESDEHSYNDMVLNVAKSFGNTAGALGETIPVINTPTTLFGALLGNKEYQSKLSWQVKNMWKPALYNELSPSTKKAIGKTYSPEIEKKYQEYIDTETKDKIKSLRNTDEYKNATDEEKTKMEQSAKTRIKNAADRKYKPDTQSEKDTQKDKETKMDNLMNSIGIQTNTGSGNTGFEGGGGDGFEK